MSSIPSALLSFLLPPRLRLRPLSLPLTAHCTQDTEAHALNPLLSSFSTFSVYSFSQIPQECGQPHTVWTMWTAFITKHTLTCALAQRNLENTILRENSQHQRPHNKAFTCSPSTDQPTLGWRGVMENKETVMGKSTSMGEDVLKNRL